MPTSVALKLITGRRKRKYSKQIAVTLLLRHFLHSSCHVVYSQLDEISFNLENFIESRQNARTVAIPSYAPLKFHGLEPWGIISLKHTAVKAALPCPENCSACQEKCPPNAFDGDGKFQKMTCLVHTIKHAIYPLALNSEKGMKNIERVINTAGYNYWLACNECLKVCPDGSCQAVSREEAAQYLAGLPTEQRTLYEMK